MLIEYKFCFEWRFYIHLFGQIYFHVTKLERGRCEVLLGQEDPFHIMDEISHF